MDCAGGTLLALAAADLALHEQRAAELDRHLVALVFDQRSVNCVESPIGVATGGAQHGPAATGCGERPRAIEGAGPLMPEREQVIGAVEFAERDEGLDALGHEQRFGQVAHSGGLDPVDVTLHRIPRRDRITERIASKREGGHRPSERVLGLCPGGKCSRLGSVGVRTIGVAGQRLDECGVGEHPHLFARPANADLTVPRRRGGDARLVQAAGPRQQERHPAWTYGRDRASSPRPTVIASTLSKLALACGAGGREYPS